MGRPVYPYELGDPDFTWLISNFRENNPTFTPVENTCLPVVFIGEATEGAEDPEFVPTRYEEENPDSLEKGNG